MSSTGVGWTHCAWQTGAALMFGLDCNLRAAALDFDCTAHQNGGSAQWTGISSALSKVGPKRTGSELWAGEVHAESHIDGRRDQLRLLKALSSLELSTTCSGAG